MLNEKNKIEQLLQLVSQMQNRNNQHEQAWQLVTQAEKDQKEGRQSAAEKKFREAEQIERALLTECKKSYGENSRPYAAFLSDLGSILSRQGKHEEALTLLKKALEIKITIFGHFHSEVGTAYWEIGFAFKRQNRFHDAENYLQKAIEVDESINGTNHSIVGDESQELGVVSRKIGKLSTALNWFRKAKEIRSKVFNEASREYQESWFCIAATLFDLGRYEECKQEMEKLLELTRHTIGENDALYGLRLLLYARTLAMMGKPEYLEISKKMIHHLSAIEHIPQILLMKARDVALNSLPLIKKLSVMAPGERLFQEGKYQKSEEFFKEVLDKLPPEDTNIASAILSKLVEIHRRLKRLDNAAIYAKRALDIDKEKLSLDKTLININDLAASYLDVGLVLEEQGKIIESDKYFLKSEILDRTILQREPGMLHVSWRTLTRAGHMVAFGFYQKALESGLKALAPLNPELIGYERYASAHSDLAQIFQNVGEHVNAKELTEKAINILAESVGKQNPLMATFLSNLGIILYEMSQPVEASEMIQKANLIETIPKNSFLQSILVWKFRNEIGLKESNFAHDFFISYNTENEDIAEKIHNTLEKIGLDVWTFKELEDWQRVRPANDIIAEEHQQLARSRILLLIVTGTSLTSKYVLDEIQTALNNNMEIMCWYPGGIRLIPREVSTRTTSDPNTLENVARSLLQYRVSNLYGYRAGENDLSEEANSLLFRLLSIYPKHPLNERYNIDTLRNEVRHMTKHMRPIFVSTDGKVLFPELQKIEQ
ncbi:MAG: hypothetical protein QG657_1778 [Acidobacteriota bacterium]|nr:hypothetical protein [Acidobacteriota bacterium]